jgi:hypothetical protein
MSYQYGQYGEGFDLVRPTSEALCFEELVSLHGEPVKVIHETITGHDDYGHPVKAETAYTERGFLKQRPGEEALPIGHVKKPSLTVLLKQWAPVEEELYELEIGNHRYHVTGVVKNEAYLEVMATREVPV